MALMRSRRGPGSRAATVTAAVTAAVAAAKTAVTATGTTVTAAGTAPWRRGAIRQVQRLARRLRGADQPETRWAADPRGTSRI